MNNIDKDIEILNNLIAYLNLLIKKGQHKIFYNNLLWDEKTVDCINAIENVLAERKQDKERIKELEENNKKYIVKLTDEEYRRVIKNAQKDIKKQFEQKNKRQDKRVKRKI